MFDYKLLLNKSLPSLMPAKQAIFSLGLPKAAIPKREKSRVERFLDVNMSVRDLLPFLCKTPCKAI
jgi:hypothetical protein